MRFFESFKALTIDNFHLLKEVLRKYPQPVVGFTAATLAMWNEIFSYSFDLTVPECLVLSFIPEAGSERHLMQPVGVFIQEHQQKMIAYAESLAYPLRIYGVSSDFVAKYPDFAARFDIEENRDGANYIYQTADLAHLEPGKYSRKRNLINQARRAYSWEATDLTGENIQMCRQVLAEVLSEPGFQVKGSLINETKVLQYALADFEKLNQSGLVITVEGRAAAFSVFEELNSSTAVVHFEKAIRSFKGLFQVINMETARRIEMLGYKYINREEDLGDPGLRKSKLSYFPCEIRPSYILVFRRAVSV